MHWALSTGSQNEKKMSSRSKTRSSKLSSPSKISTKRIKESSPSSSNGPQEQDFMTKIVEQVLERFSESMEKVIERLVDKAVKSVNQLSGFGSQDRCPRGENRRSALLQPTLQWETTLRPRWVQQGGIVYRQIFFLFFFFFWRYTTPPCPTQHCKTKFWDCNTQHAANFVMSGVPEKESTAYQRPENFVLQACKDLQIDLSVSDLVEVRRLGRPSQDISWSRPRPLLVKTANKEIKTRIVTQARANHRENCTVYFKEDLTKEEQARRKTLVPTYKELRKKAVKCRLERTCIMIDDRMIFDQGEAEAVLRSLQSPLHVPTSSPGSSPVSRNLLKAGPPPWGYFSHLWS